MFCDSRNCIHTIIAQCVLPDVSPINVCILITMPCNYLKDIACIDGRQAGKHCKENAVQYNRVHI